VFNELGYRADLVFQERPVPGRILDSLQFGKRRLPRIIIAGAQKSGTTSLYSYLARHPAIVPPRLKEVFFLGNDIRYAKGLSFYRKNFPTERTAAGRQTIDASVDTLDHPRAPHRVREIMPDAKVVVLLRDPVERAWAHYRMAVRNGVEGLSFSDALEKEAARISAGAGHPHNYCYQRLGYRSRGEYVRLLPPWLEAFGAKQLMIVCAEEFFRDTPTIYASILRFLELDEHFPERFEAVNADRSRGPMGDAACARLTAHFAPLTRALEALLQRPFPWDRP
jgi:hypothetical protein